jgi:hypothetical protein
MAGRMFEETLADIKRYVENMTRSGFHSKPDIIKSTLEVFCDDAPSDILLPHVEEMAREATEKLLCEQRSWPDITDCDRLDDAFAELTQSGIVCRQDFSCCGNCGVAEIGQEMETERRKGIEVFGYAFYHMQDTESAAAGYGLYLNYGSTEHSETASVEIGNRIVETLERHGLKTNWNGRLEARIGVAIDWKRRVPYQISSQA